MQVQRLKRPCARFVNFTRHPHLAWLVGLSLFAIFTAIVQAEDEPAKPAAGAPISSRQAVTAYADAANIQNNGEFELAAEEWAKFIKKFDSDPLATSARHYLGVCRMQAEDFPEAARWFQAAVDSKKGDFKSIDESYLNLGWCLYSIGLGGDVESFGKAQTALTELLKQHPETELADQALFYLGECAYHLGQPEKAIEAYQKLVADHPKSDLRPDALYAEIVTRQELGQHEASGKSIEAFLNDYPDHDLRQEIRMRKAESLLQQGKIAAAENLFAELAEIADFPSIDHVLVRQAYCSASQEKFAEAAELYKRIIEKLSDSPYLIDSQLGAGRCYFQLGQWDAAIGSLEKITDADGLQSAEAAHWLSRVYLKQDRADEALKVTEAAIALSADSPFLVDLKLDRADALFAIDGHKDEAMSAFLEISKQYPDSPRASLALYNAALTALEQEKYEEAEKYSDQLIGQFADDPIAVDAKYVRSESQLLAGQHAEAAASFAKLLEAHPDHPDAESWNLRQALALFLQKEYQPTIDLLTNGIDELTNDDQRAHALYLIGTSHSHLGRDQQSVDALQKSLQANPQWSQGDKVLLNLARAQRKLGQASAATTTLEQLTSQFADSPYVDRAWYQLAELTFDRERYDQAIEYYQRILDEHPESALIPEALYGLGWSQLKTNDHAAALTTLARLIDGHGQHPLVAGALQARAVCRQNTGDFQGVVDDTEKLLKTSPTGEDLAAALYQRGVAATKLEQTEKAIESFTRIVKEVKDYASMPNVVYELAWSHSSAGDTDSALAWFKRLADEYPESQVFSEAAFHLGEGAYSKERYADAATWYAKALERGEDAVLSEKSTYKLGWSEYQQKQYEPALVAFNRLLEQHHDAELAGEAQFMTAECLFRLKRYEEALAAYERSRGGLQGSEAAAVLTLLHGGQSAAQLEKWQDATQWLQQILEKYPQSAYVDRARYEEAWARQNLNQLEQAGKLYTEVADSARNAVGARARFMLGELMFSQKQFESASAEFKRVMYGYGGDSAPKSVQPWQAKAGLEAGRCSTVLAGRARNQEKKNGHLQQAEKCFRFVLDQHAETDEAQVAAGQLKRLGR